MICEHLTSALIPLDPLDIADLLAGGWDVPSTTGEVPLGGDPVVVERRLAVLDDRQADGRTVARSRDRLVGCARDSSRGVDAIDVRTTRTIDRNHVLATALFPRHLEGREVLTVRPGSRDDAATFGGRRLP